MRVLFRLTIAMLGSALFACKPLPTLALMHPTGPIQPLRMVTGCHGELLASMDSATGDDVHLLPSGDMLLSGNAQTGFLLRLSPDGRVRWSLRTCSTPQVAVAGDDAIYASADAFLGASEPSEEAIRECRRLRNSVRPDRKPTTILRLDGLGRTEWTHDAPDLTGVVALATRERVIVLGMRHNGGDVTRSLTSDGRVEWETKDRAGSVKAAWSPAGRLLIVSTSENVATDASPPIPCVLRSYGPPSGELIWQRELEIGRACRPEQLLVSPSGGLLLSFALRSGGHVDDFITGFDPETGVMRWQRSFSPEDFVRSSSNERFDRYGAPFVVKYQPYATKSGSGSEPVFVAVDPRTGRAAKVAKLQTNLEANARSSPDVRYPDFGADVTSVHAEYGALLATGRFRGRLALGSIHLDSRPETEKICKDAYGRLASGAADERGNCPYGTEDVLGYRPALFVLRLSL